VGETERERGGKEVERKRESNIIENERINRQRERERERML
jgi:hypothetical protein